MSEAPTQTFERLQPAQAIAQVISSWMTTEIINSQSGNNAFLNEYDDFAAQLSLPFRAAGNAFAHKSTSHSDRLDRWTNELFANNPDDDKTLALQLFGALMGAAGALRVQQLFISHSQADYSSKRNNSGLGVDIDMIARQHLLANFGIEEPAITDLKRPTISHEELMAETRRVNQLRDETHEKLWRGQHPSNLRRMVAVWRLAELRRQWTGLSVDYITYAAQQRDGDLTKVPFMEPTSITYAEMVYPLANEPPYFGLPDETELQVTGQ